MKKLFLKIALFLLIVFLVEKPIGYFISKGIVKRQFDQRLENLFAGKVLTDVVILGSSRSLNGIDAGQLQKNLSQTVYNFGFSGSNLNFHESIFNIVTGVYHPKKILLVVDDKDAFKINEKAIFRKDKLFPFIQYEPVLKEICNYSSKAYLPSRVSWLYRENQNLFEAFNFYTKGKMEPDETTNVNEYGFIALADDNGGLNNLTKQSLSINYVSDNENNTYIESLQAIVDKCKELKIDLYLIRLPTLNAKLEGFNERLKLIAGNDAKILDFSKELQEEEYHFDNGHLSGRGAKSCADIISKQLLK